MADIDLAKRTVDRGTDSAGRWPALQRILQRPQRELHITSSFVLALIDGDGAIVSEPIRNLSSGLPLCTCQRMSQKGLRRRGRLRRVMIENRTNKSQFQDALLREAAGDGGSTAAFRLHQAIHNHISSLYSNSSNWPVMVHIYLSLDKLAFKLQQVGLLRHSGEMRTFAQRFSTNQSLFSIIDVGQGKERADHRLKGMLQDIHGMDMD